jgi:hypothetical protein
LSCSCCCRDIGKDKADEEALLEIHLTALDDLVNVNSLFTIAVFVGLSYAHPGQLTSLDNRPECNADSDTAKRLVVYEVVSFSLFLLSSLVAKMLKVHFQIHRKYYFGNNDSDTATIKKIFWPCYRRVMLLLSVCGSILGCVFLTLSMVHVIQIRVGKLSCGSEYTVLAVAPLVTIVGIALCIYTCTMTEPIFASNAKLLAAMK